MMIRFPNELKKRTRKNPPPTNISDFSKTRKTIFAQQFPHRSKKSENGVSVSIFEFRKRLNRQFSFYSFDEISFSDGCFELSIFLFTSQRRQIKHSPKDNLKSKHSRKH